MYLKFYFSEKNPAFNLFKFNKGLSVKFEEDWLKNEEEGILLMK